MNKTLAEVLGWYGTIAILLAYTLVSFSILSSQSIWFQILNGTGAIGLVIISIQDKEYQTVVLNIIWAVIALVAILNILR